jgi:hypothetical protein
MLPGRVRPGNPVARPHGTGWPGASSTADEGAAGHCDPLAVGLRGERVLDWPARQLA